MEMCDCGTEDMACIVEGKLDIGSDIGDISVIQSNRMPDIGLHFIRGVGYFPIFLVYDVEVVELKHCREVTRGRRAVHRAVISVFIKEGDECAVVQVSMGQYYGIKLERG